LHRFIFLFLLKVPVCVRVKKYIKENKTQCLTHNKKKKPPWFIEEEKNIIAQKQNNLIKKKINTLKLGSQE